MNKTQLEHLAANARKHLASLEEQLQQARLRRDEAELMLSQIEEALEGAGDSPKAVPDIRHDDGRRERTLAVREALHRRGGSARFSELMRDMQQRWPGYTKNHMSQDLQDAEDKPYRKGVRRGVYELK